MTIGEKLYSLRIERKLSQERLSELINVTRQTISNWELDRTQPNPDQLKLLSKIFNISIDELLDNETSINTESVTSNPNNETKNEDKSNHNIFKPITAILGGICVLLFILLLINLISNINNVKKNPSVVTTVVHTGETKYIVVYNPDNGDDLIAFTVYEGDYLNFFIPPEKEGYLFVGWFYKDKEWIYAEDRVYENITLVARWEKE